MYKEKTIKEIDKLIFRSNDIRGIVQKQLDENVYYTLGKAIGYKLYKLNIFNIFIARDCRLTSNIFSSAIQYGLITSGINVYNIGETITPVLYYATHTSNISNCGIMITGSHNPYNYNGIKIVLNKQAISYSEIQDIYKIIEYGKYSTGQGIVFNVENIINNYINDIKKNIILYKPLKIVIDCGNSIAGPIVKSVMKILFCEVIDIYCEVDGHFPNHYPDPTIEDNLKDLQYTIKLHKADLGFSFDGDADRLVVITNKQEIIWPDRLLMLYSKYILKNNKGSVIVYDIKCSSLLKQVIVSCGGIAKMCPTGHSIVKHIMNKENAILAGEMSGHIFFKDRWYGFDDAVYSACRLLEIVSLHKKSVSEIFKEVPNGVNTPEIRIPMSDNNKFIFIKKLVKNFEYSKLNIIKIDGLRIEFIYGWGLIRASNTTPCLIARFEAKNEYNLKKIKNVFMLILKKIDKNLLLNF